MEWSISKQMYNISSSPMNQSHHLNFTGTPARDFVNPGVGGSMNMFTYFVPIYSKNVLEVQKQIQPPSETNPTEPGQSGSGLIENNEIKHESMAETSNIHASKMEPSIYQSFQHPKFVKTNKIIFDLKRKGTEPKSSEAKRAKTVGGGKSGLNHKFQFHDEK